MADIIKTIKVTNNISIIEKYWNREKNEVVYTPSFTIEGKEHSSSYCFESFADALIYAGLTLKRMEVNAARFLMSFITGAVHENKDRNTILSEKDMQIISLDFYNPM
jgi:hypothetical protein